MSEYQPWEGGEKDIQKALPERKTFDTSEGMAAIRGVREKMGGVLKKDQALKVSMYTGEKIKRKEGETWTDSDGKEWEMKGGIARSIPKLQGAKMPWWCPKCSGTMKTKLDTKMWFRRGTCHGCVLVEETEMRVNGTWQEYQRRTLYANTIAKIKDTIAEFKGFQETVSNPQIHFQDGTFEEWKVGTKKVKEDLQEEIDKLESRLMELQKEMEDMDT